MSCEIKTVWAKIVKNKTSTEVCPDCHDRGFYTVQNVYTGPHEVPCEFCENGLEVYKDLFPELNDEVIRVVSTATN